MSASDIDFCVPILEVVIVDVVSLEEGTDKFLGSEPISRVFLDIEELPKNWPDDAPDILEFSFDPDIEQGNWIQGTLRHVNTNDRSYRWKFINVEIWDLPPHVRPVHDNTLPRPA